MQYDIKIDTVPQLFPAAQTPELIHIVATPLSGQAAIPEQTLPEAGIVTMDLSQGSWQLDAMRRDVNGQTMGSVMTGRVDVPAPDVSVNVPSALTITLHPVA